MTSKVLFITILVFVLINFISTMFVKQLVIHRCVTDEDVHQKSLGLEKSIVPIILVKDKETYPYEYAVYEKKIIDMLKDAGVKTLLIINADTCVGAAAYLNNRDQVKYSQFFLLKNGHLLKEMALVLLPQIEKLLAKAVRRNYIIQDIRSFEFQSNAFKLPSNVNVQPEWGRIPETELNSVSLNENFVIQRCTTDKEVHQMSLGSKKWIASIILVKDGETFPYGHIAYEDKIIDMLEGAGVKKLLIINADTCVGAAGYLNNGVQVKYPLFFLLKNGHLLQERALVLLPKIENLLAKAAREKHIIRDTQSFEFRSNVFKTNSNVNVQPEWGPNAQPAVVGLTIPETKPHVERSVPETRNVVKQERSSDDRLVHKPVIHKNYFKKRGTNSRSKSGESSKINKQSP